jgi:uncharacterized protein YjiS (DUF1127 family)
MAALVHQPLTNCQVQTVSGLPFPTRLAQPGFLTRLRVTLRLWRRRARERAALTMLDDRALRDIRLTRSDVWHETRQPFWRDTARY